MALFQCHFYSHALRQQVAVNVILPQAPPEALSAKGWKSKAGKRPLYKTLFLLHGLSDDQTIWLRRTSIERYADSLGLAVVMPAVHRSFYQDQALGVEYWRFVSEELPGLVRSTFPLSPRREDTFAAGLSMGGYGAFRLGLGRPENYAAVASLSGALDFKRIFQDSREGRNSILDNELDAIFGAGADFPDSSDLFALLEGHLKAGKELPRLYQACGTEDFLWADNERFRDFAKKLKKKHKALDHTWEQGPGAHDWAYWDRMIQNVLAWLNIRAD